MAAPQTGLFSATIAATTGGVSSDIIYVAEGAQQSAINGADLGTKGSIVLNCEVSNGAATALSSFIVEAQDHPSGEWYTFITDAVFTAGIVGGNVLFVSSTIPGSLGAGAVGHFSIRLNAAYAVRFKATLASSTGTITVRGSKHTI